jgi:hypothetical protein
MSTALVYYSMLPIARWISFILSGDSVKDMLTRRGTSAFALYCFGAGAYRQCWGLACIQLLYIGVSF